MVVATILREPMMKELGVSDMGFATLGSVIFAGLIVGNLAGGFLADAFGRRGTLLGTGALVCLAGAASAAAIDIYTFAVLRFLTGIGIGSLIPEGRPLPIYTADIAAARAPGAPGARAASAPRAASLGRPGDEGLVVLQGVYSRDTGRGNSREGGGGGGGRRRRGGRDMGPRAGRKGGGGGGRCCPTAGRGRGRGAGVLERSFLSGGGPREARAGGRWLPLGVWGQTLQHSAHQAVLHPCV